MTSALHVGVFGAGAIGAYVGARLAHAGTRVTLLARPSLVRELDAHGATLSDYRGFSAHVEGLHASDDVQVLRDATCVLVAVKSGDTEAAARALAPVLRPDAIVVSFQNGVRNPDVLRAGLLGANVPRANVLAAMVPFNVVRSADGHFHQGTSGTLVIASHPGAVPLRDALISAGLPAVLDPAIEGKQWGKLLVNLGNAVNALSGVPIRTMIAKAGYRRVMASAFREAELLLRRAGIRPRLEMPVPARLVPRVLRLPDALFRFVLPVMAKVDAEARSSMSDDLMRGRRTEVDYLNGEIVRLAERLGTSAPINARIVELVHAAEAKDAADGPSSLSADALERALR